MRMLVTGGSGFIGLNHMIRLLGDSIPVTNIDLRPPSLPEHKPHWAACDLLDRDRLFRLVAEIRPTHIIHYAARSDTLSQNVADYDANIQSTANLIDALQERAGVERVVFVSSQFVHQTGGLPVSDTDFAPHTAYGESKVAMERLIRSRDLSFRWVIVRPTNIWGPWHPRYPREFWRVLRAGYYLHPGNCQVIRSYGYVRNVVDQIQRLLTWQNSGVDGQVYYVGDPPVDLRVWVNGFSHQLCGRGVTTVPRHLVRCLALAGDACEAIGVRFPITSSRFRSMTTSNPAPMERTLALLGAPLVPMEQGIAETVAWLRRSDPDFWGAPTPAANAPIRA